MFWKNIKKLAHPLQQLQWTLRDMSVVARSLKYSQYGEPQDVLQLVESKIDDPKGKEVLVKILVAPINPADINTIQGKYPVKPKFPAVAGNECVAEIISVGEQVQNLKAGQHVVPFTTGLGTWTTHALYNEDEVMAVSKNIGLIEASTITVNPCTAYRMLKDFVQLLPGDTVIQNGANSAVGQAVHQLCRIWNIKSVGVVRDRPEIQELKNQLKSLGASEILTEKEIRKSTIFKDGTFKKPKLAFNCVGGNSASEVTRHLGDRGVMVTYGGMSREPLIAATGSLIFKDISYRGFWMTRWSKEHFFSGERKKMFDDLCELIEQGKFIGPPHEIIPIEQYKEAAAAALNFKGFTGKKFILRMNS